MPRVTAFAMFYQGMTANFRGNGDSKNRCLRDRAGEPIHATRTFLFNSLLYNIAFTKT